MRKFFILTIGALSVALTPVSATEDKSLEHTLAQTKVLGAGYSARVNVDGQRASVSAFLPRNSRAKENDSKIDALLIARALRAAKPDLDSIKVVLFDETDRTKTYTATITAAQLKQFEQSKTPVTVILKSVKVAVANVPASSAPAPTGTQLNARRLPDGSSNEPFTNYIERSTGLAFAYPSKAKLSEAPEKDVLLKISAAGPGGLPYEISMRDFQGPAGIDPYLVMQYLNAYLVPKLPGASVVQQDQVLCGKDGRILAHTATLNVHDKDGAYRQKWAVFADPGDANKVRLMVFTSPERAFAATEPVFNSVLNSLNHPTANLYQTAVRTSSTQEPRFAAVDRPFSFEDISFRFPGNWNIEEHPDKDTIAKFKCPANLGGAEMGLGCLPVVSFSNAQIAKMIQDKYWAPMKDLNVHPESQQQWGARKDVSGFRQMATFAMDKGRAASQMFVFQQNGRVFCLTFTTYGVKEDEAVKQFDHVLSTLAVR